MMMMMMMMDMSFWFGTDLGIFLFPGYNVATVGCFVATCLGIVALAILYEGMKTVQIKLHQKSKASMMAGTQPGSTEDSSLLSRIVPSIPSSLSLWNALGQWSLEVLHYSAHNTLGYILMLAAMTYNAYICIALVMGAAIGYFIFGLSLLDLNLNEIRQTYNAISCEPECSDAIVSQRRQSVVSNVAEEIVSEINAEIHGNINTT